MGFDYALETGRCCSNGQAFRFRHVLPSGSDGYAAIDFSIPTWYSRTTGLLPPLYRPLLVRWRQTGAARVLV